MYTKNALQTFEDIDLFHLIGVVCGLAIYNLTIVELNFPVALYKKLLKKSPTLDDLKEMMPDVGRLGHRTIPRLDLNVPFGLLLSKCNHDPFFGIGILLMLEKTVCLNVSILICPFTPGVCSISWTTQKMTLRTSSV